MHVAGVLDDLGLFDKACLLECLNRAALGIGGMDGVIGLNNSLAIIKWLSMLPEWLAQRPGGRAPGNRRVPSLAPGDKVTHDAYGLGTELSVQGSGDDPEAKIDFGGEYGVKHLVLRYAPIEKL